MAAQPAAVVAAEVASGGGAAGLRRYRRQQARIRGRGAGEGVRQQVLCCDSRRGGVWGKAWLGVELHAVATAAMGNVKRWATAWDIFRYLCIGAALTKQADILCSQPQGCAAPGSACQGGRQLLMQVLGGVLVCVWATTVNGGAPRCGLLGGAVTGAGSLSNQSAQLPLPCQ